MMSNTAKRNFVTAGVALAVLASASAVVSTSAFAKTKAFTKTNSYCADNNGDGAPDNPCAALVYANGGSYQVKTTKVEMRDNDYDSDPACNGVDMSSNNSLNEGDYGVFIVPAPCRYKVTIDINGGSTKSTHPFVTPGCELVLESKGTSLNDNKPKKKTIEWTDAAKDELADKGITVSNSDVSDEYWHQAQGQNEKHACKIDN